MSRKDEVIRLKTSEEVDVFMELEDLDRSAWDLPPITRTFRECPNCTWWHNKKTKCCSWFCSLISVFR
jgi:hypothetical protein